MKQTSTKNQLSLNKVTVAHLDKSQALAIKGGNVIMPPTIIPTQKSALPEALCRLTIIQPGTLL